MNPDNIEKLIKKLNLPGTRAGDERILNDALTAFERADRSKSETLQPNIWKRITKAQKARLIAAAMIVIAAGIGLSVLSTLSDHAEQGPLKQIEGRLAKKPDTPASSTITETTKDFSPETKLCNALESSHYGISVEGLTRDEACREILAQFWNAIIIGDLTCIRQLFPIARDWDDNVLKDNLGLSDEDYLVELLEIGQPYADKETSDAGLVIVPSLFKCVAGRKQEVQMVIQFCRTDDKPFCVIQGGYGCAGEHQVLCCDSSM